VVGAAPYLAADEAHCRARLHYRAIELGRDPEALCPLRIC
jgi:hypothetical protein